MNNFSIFFEKILKKLKEKIKIKIKYFSRSSGFGFSPMVLKYKKIKVVIF